MKIITRYPSDDYEGHLEISMTTDSFAKSIAFGRGEPEDNALCRDLSDAYHIEEMLTAAYNAGKNGEELICESEDQDDDE